MESKSHSKAPLVRSRAMNYRDGIVVGNSSPPVHRWDVQRRYGAVIGYTLPQNFVLSPGILSLQTHADKSGRARARAGSNGWIISLRASTSHFYRTYLCIHHCTQRFANSITYVEIDALRDRTDVRFNATGSIRGVLFQSDSGKFI